MSEYQFLHFLAIDRPVSEKNLAFMRRQSTRAEITPWEFTNEYHFGDFHGDALEMLRRGYDLHFHYANFGIRRLLVRLPAGLPCDRRTFTAFRVPGALEWIADKQGPGGILELNPETDTESYTEDLWDVDRLLPKIAPLREALIGGDLRMLYVAWLGCVGDEEQREPPVPAGLEKRTLALSALAELFEISEDLVAAAAEASPPLPETGAEGTDLRNWLTRQSHGALCELVQQLLGEGSTQARAETLARIRDETGALAWPMAEPTRTLEQLHQQAEVQATKRLEREQRKEEAARHKRLKAIASDPDTVLAEVERLVASRSTVNYEKAAGQLADLREALGPDRGVPQTRAVAERLHREHPRWHSLTAALRSQGLLD